MGERTVKRYARKGRYAVSGVQGPADGSTAYPRLPVTSGPVDRFIPGPVPSWEKPANDHRDTVRRYQSSTTQVPVSDEYIASMKANAGKNSSNVSSANAL